MEHLPQPLGALLIEASTGAQRARGARLQSIQAPLVEGVDGISDRLGATSQTPSDLGRALSARTRQKYLASPQNKGVIGAQPGAESLALLFRKRTYEDWRFHEDYHSSYHTIYPDDALETHAGTKRWSGMTIASFKGQAWVACTRAARLLPLHYGALRRSLILYPPNCVEPPTGEVRRISLPRTLVNKGNKGKEASYATCPFSSSLLEQP